MKKVIVGGLILLVIAALAGFAAVRWGPWFQEDDSGVLMASGTVEATQVRMAFRMPGTLVERRVDEGDDVAVSQPIATLDQRDAEASLREAEAAVAAAAAELDELTAGYRVEEIAVAQAAVEEARVTFRRLQDEAAHSRSLYDAEAISREQRDRDVTDAEAAGSRLESAREHLTMLQAGYRPQQIEAARARLKQAQARRANAQIFLDDTVIDSPIEGVVTRTHAEVGETLAAGRAVATLTELGAPWVRVYISEVDIGLIRLGAKARARVDSYPGRDFPGTVTYVAAEAEFTPKNVQTQEERVKLVFAVDVSLDNPEGALKPGMPADVYIEVQ
ncbi:MAG TPA: efflux RND transporter periplasmic adaptor subunit [Arenicellales bacterium]|nr:efflux RND transporter periplasmic adaptor subunit [Arenicellales bacterium]